MVKGAPGPTMLRRYYLREETKMSDLETAKRALRQTSQQGLQYVEKEYLHFLDALRDMEGSLGFSGVTFDLPADAQPNTLNFETLLGTICMDRSLVLHDDRIAFAVAFTDVDGSTAAKPAVPLWWVQLNWSTPWRDAAGAELARNFTTDRTKAHLVMDAVLNAIAEKLLRNTKRLVEARCLASADDKA